MWLIQSLCLKYQNNTIFHNIKQYIFNDYQLFMQSKRAYNMKESLTPEADVFFFPCRRVLD